MREVEAECVRRLGKEVLDNMINRATIQLACQERNIVVTKAEVEKEIVRIASEFKIPLEQYLQNNPDAPIGDAQQNFRAATFLTTPMSCCRQNQAAQKDRLPDSGSADQLPNIQLKGQLT